MSFSDQQLYSMIFRNEPLNEVKVCIRELTSELSKNKNAKSSKDIKNIIIALLSNEEYSSLISDILKELANQLLTEKHFQQIILATSIVSNESVILELLNNYDRVSVISQSKQNRSYDNPWGLIVCNFITSSKLEALEWLINKGLFNKKKLDIYLQFIPSAQTYSKLLKNLDESHLNLDFLNEIEDSVLTEIIKNNSSKLECLLQKIEATYDSGSAFEFTGSFFHYAIFLNKQEFVRYYLDNNLTFDPKFITKDNDKLSLLFICRSLEMFNLLEQKTSLKMDLDDALKYCQYAIGGFFYGNFQIYENMKPYSKHNTGFYYDKFHSSYNDVLKIVDHLIDKYRLSCDQFANFIKNDFVFNEIIDLSTKSGYSNIIKNFCLPKLHPQLSSANITNIIIFFKTKSDDYVKQILNANDLSDEVVINLTKHAISGFYNPLIGMLLEKFSKLLISSEEIKELVNKIHVSQIAVYFIKHGFKYSKDDLIRLKTIADIQGDIHSIDLIDKQLSTLGKKQSTLWKYSTGKLINLNIPQELEHSIKKAYGTGISQKDFKEYCQQVTNLITGNMLCGRFSLIDDPKASLHLNHLGDLRRWIAWKSSSSDEDQFGLPRMGGMQTPLVGRYYPFCTKFLEEMLPRYEDSNYIKNFKYAVVNNKVIFQAQIVGFIDEDPIDLTSFSLDDGFFGWKHSSFKNIEIILNHVQKMIDDVLELSVYEEANKDALIKKIATIHWWLAHATPFNRGSAAITEMIVKAIFQYHGFKVDWKPLIDCEALISPSVEDFSIRYYTFFEEFSSLPERAKPDIAMTGSPLYAPTFTPKLAAQIATPQLESKEEESYQFQ